MNKLCTSCYKVPALVTVTDPDHGAKYEWCVLCANKVGQVSDEELNAHMEEILNRLSPM